MRTGTFQTTSAKSAVLAKMWTRNYMQIVAFSHQYPLSSKTALYLTSWPCICYPVGFHKQSLREYLTSVLMLNCQSSLSVFLGVVCLQDENSSFFSPFNTAGRIETQINYSASKNAEEQEVLYPHSTNQSVLMALDRLVWKTNGAGSRQGVGVSV